MKISFALTFLLLPVFGFNQITKKNNHQDLLIDKWTKAVINIEAYPNFTAQYDSIRTSTTMNTMERYKAYKRLDDLKLQSKWSGTAIFLEDSGIYFLLTARHVIADPFKPDEVCETIILANDVQHVYADTGKQENDYIDTIHDIIVSNTYNGMLQNVSMHLSNYYLHTSVGANLPDESGWIFTNQDTDLAAARIYEDDFLDTLRSRYTPITLQDIDLLESSHNWR